MANLLNIQSIESASEKLVRLMGGRDCKLVFRAGIAGPMADISKGIIYYPRLPEKLNEEDFQLLMGAIDHEWGHIEFTKYVDGTRPEKPAGTPGLISNAVEDGRIHRLIPTKFPGALHNLRSMERVMNKAYAKGIKEGKLDPSDIRFQVTAALIESSYKLVWRDPEVEGCHYGDFVNATMPTALVTQWEAIETYEDVEGIVDPTMDWLKQFFEDNVQEKPEPQAGESESQESGDGEPSDEESQESAMDNSFDDLMPESDDDDSDDDGDSDSEGDQDGDDSGDGESDDSDASEKGSDSSSDKSGAPSDDSGDESGDGDDGDADGENSSDSDVVEDDGFGGNADKGSDKPQANTEGKSDDCGKTEKESEPAMADTENNEDFEKFMEEIQAIAETIEKLIEEEKANAMAYMEDRSRYAPDTSRDRERHITELYAGLGKSRYHDAENYQREVDRVFGGYRGLVGSLRTRLVMDLQSTGNLMTRNLRRGKRIDTARLARAGVGDSRVFANKRKQEDINTAVTLVIDCSGSMSDSGKIDKALQLAALFCEALEMAQVPCEVLGFTTRNDVSVPGGCRDEALEHIVFKTFTEPMRTNRDKWLAAKTLLSCNVDGESVMWAAKRLIQRNEKRKVLMVLSDGQPAAGMHYGSFGMLRAHLRDTVDRIEKSGIECLGIGILSSAVASFYPKWVTYGDLTQLMTGVYATIRDLLQGKGLSKAA